MAGRVGGFTSPEGADTFYRTYDDVVARRWPIDREELDVPTRFGTTHVRRCAGGDGIPLVLVHPTAGSSAGWYPLIEGLAGDRTAYLPDTIGAPGRSVQTAPISEPTQLARWLDDVLDALDLDRVHLLGYSEGGWIALLHAAHTARPDRVVTLTLIEPAGIQAIPRRTLAALIGRGAAVLLARDKARAVRRLNTWMNGDVELTDDQIDLLMAALGTFKQKLPAPGPLPDDALRRISAPTLLLLGQDSTLYDWQKVDDRARTLMSDVQIQTLENAGHGLAFQYPDQVTTRIRGFIETHA